MTEQQINWIVIVAIVLIVGNLSTFEFMSSNKFYFINLFSLFIAIVIRIFSFLFAGRVVKRSLVIIMWLRTVPDQEWEVRVQPWHETLLFLYGQQFGGPIYIIMTTLLVSLAIYFDFHTQSIIIISMLGMLYLSAKEIIMTNKVRQHL